MNALILYDSQFGNTEKIAQAIGLGLGADTKVLSVKETTTNILNNFNNLDVLNILIVGSPTQGGKATLSVKNLINNIPTDGLKNIKVAAFDTRFLEKDKNFALRALMKTVGYAAEKIAKLLESKGGHLALPPEAFFVEDKEGPLKDGELARAAEWAKKILQH